MSEIFTTFGVDWKLLLLQGVNFGILLTGLTYFLYKPLGNMLEARRQKVAQGVQDAEEARRSLQEIEGARGAKLAAAGREADELVAGARALATEREREIVGKAETTAATLLAEAEARASEAKTRAIEESKEEVAKMIVLGMEKAFSKSK